MRHIVEGHIITGGDVGTCFPFLKHGGEVLGRLTESTVAPLTKGFLLWLLPTQKQAKLGRLPSYRSFFYLLSPAFCEMHSVILVVDDQFFFSPRFKA